MDYIKYKVDEAKILEIKNFYHARKITDPKQQYHMFFIRLPNGVVVDGFTSKKGYSVLFSGDKSKITIEAALFFSNPQTMKPSKSKIITATGWEDSKEQIGSDEVGVGDFFQGFYICAAYLNASDVEYINSLGVMDSKKLTDAKIEQIAPLLEKNIRKFLVRISPDKLTEMHDKNWSTHVMLSQAHNFAQEQLIKKYNLSKNLTVYIDQFEKEAIYKRYTGPSLISNPLVFRTKGESYYPSVATASVIARYEFLQDWKKMEAELGMTIPKGAGLLADNAYNTLIEKYGKKKLDPYVKRFFRNYTGTKC